jgi:hypothetical protein
VVLLFPQLREKLKIMEQLKLLQNQLLLTESYVLNIKSDLDLKMQRLTLSRLVVEGDFSKIKGCVLSNTTEHRSIFRREKPQSLDELCK